MYYDSICIYGCECGVSVVWVWCEGTCINDIFHGHVVVLIRQWRHDDGEIDEEGGEQLSDPEAVKPVEQIRTKRLRVMQSIEGS